LSDELDIVGADVAVLVDDVVVDPFTVEEEDPDPVRTGGSEAVVVLTAWCEGFIALLRLRDQNSDNVKPRHACPQPPSSFVIAQHNRNSQS
jgi:hypothetical protein